MPDDELSQLFPDLAPILANWGNYGGGGMSGLQLDEHGGVTDDQVDQYIQSRMSNGQRVGPNPAVSGQQPPAAPQFQSGQGLQVPPPGGTEPAGDNNHAGPVVPAAPPPQDQQPAPTAPVAPPAAPTPPAGGAPPPAGGEPPQPPQPPEIPAERLEAYRQFDEMLREDEGLRNRIAEYLQQKAGQAQQQAQQPQPFQPPQPQPTFPPTPVQPPQVPVVPQPQPPQLYTPSAEDLAADPVLASIWQTVQQQQQVIEGLSSNFQATQAQMAQRQQAEATSLINERVTAFQQTRVLDDAQMQRVREEAGRTAALQSYMEQGMSAPEAIDKVLDLAFWSIPEFRESALAQQAQAQREDARKKQLAGSVSGSSGSTPRQPNAVPTDARERQKELIGVVGEMMNGTYVSPDQ